MELSTDRTTVLAGMLVPLTGIPGEIGVLPPFVVSARPVTTAVVLNTPLCWIVIALNSGASVTRLLFEPSHRYQPDSRISPAVSLILPDWNPSDEVPRSAFCAAALAAVSSARPAVVLSEIAVETCEWFVGALPLSRACSDDCTLLVKEPDGVTAIKLAATKAIVEKSTIRIQFPAARSVANVPDVCAMRQR